MVKVPLKATAATSLLVNNANCVVHLCFGSFSNPFCRIVQQSVHNSFLVSPEMLFRVQVWTLGWVCPGISQFFLKWHVLGYCLALPWVIVLAQPEDSSSYYCIHFPSFYDIEFPCL